MKQDYCFSQLRLLVAVLFLFSTISAFPQNREPLQPKTTKTETLPSKVVAPFSLAPEKREFDNTVKKATYLKLDDAALKDAMKENPRELVFRLPQKNGKVVELLLEKQEILSADFKVTDPHGNLLPYEPGQYFTGTVLNRNGKRENKSIASLSVVGNEVMAMMTLDGDNFVLGTLKDAQGRQTSDYVLYNDEDIQEPNVFECGTDMDKHFVKNDQPGSGAEMPVGKNIVRVQFEADHQMYQDFGGNSTNITNYVTGLFNAVATIYKNEDIQTQISWVVVWNVPDPYGISSSVGSGDVLNAFRDRKNLVGMNGDLAHLLSTKNVGHGGIAWVDVLCHGTTGYRTAYSNIASTYNAFPFYSWTVDVVTHEMGHNLGSPHTHDCVWGAANNSAIDNCYTPSGSCSPGPTPTNGGTIMSYCHLTAAGKNFNLGFGSQPGSLIRSKVNGASCLSKAYLNCAGAAPIYCGVPVNGSTVGAANNVNYYGCNSWLQSGGEKVYVLQTTGTSTITATLTNLSADLDVIILDACSETNCLAEGNNSATVANASAGTYYIVVDGYGGAAGTFTLTVNCSGYCFTVGGTNYEFIQRAQIGTIDNNSGNNYGLADFTNLKTPVQRGGSAPVTLTPGFISSAWKEYWRIWIDANQDQDFNDPGELVFDSGAASTGVASGNLNVPANAKLGATRMRVAMRYNSAPTACGTFSGEVEDYTVVIEPYCPSVGRTAYEFIEAIRVKEFEVISGNNGGYANFTGSPIPMLENEVVPFKLKPGFVSSTWQERWNIWIDYNQDFDFEDEGELVFSSEADTAGIEGEFVIPETALAGTTRMRITMQYYDSPASCSYVFYGETEDYTVLITPFCPGNANSGFEYIQSVGIGSLIYASGNNGGYGDFTTTVFDVIKGEPTGLLLTPGFTSTIYEEYWRIWVDKNQNQVFEDEEQVFEAGPTSDAVLGAFILPEDVNEGKYGLRVAMRYGDFPFACGNYGYGEVEDYFVNITGSGAQGNIGSRNSDGVSAIPVLESDFNIFPNPAKEMLNFQWVNMEPVLVNILSSNGQVIRNIGQSSFDTSLNIRELPSGMYFVQVLTTDNQMKTKRFVKAD